MYFPAQFSSRRWQWVTFILILLAVIIMVVSNQQVSADNQTYVVQVSPQTWHQLADVRAITQHTYNTFIWLELSSAGFAQLQASGAEYQLQADPFTLTLGEQRFDPLRQTAAFSGDWGVAPSHGGPDLHLVQFTGPTKAEWLDALTSSGLEIVQYIHPYTYVVWASDSQMQSLANLAMVRWTASFLPAYRVLPQWRQLPAKSLQVDVLMYGGADTDSTVRQLEALGSPNLRRATLNQTWEITGLFLPGDQLLTAAQIPGVYSIQPIPTDGGLRGEMSNQINVNNHDGSNQAFPGYQTWLNGAGVDGSGIIIANVDSGVLETHADLVNRFIACIGVSCGNSTNSNHGTHTAGIMAADGASGLTDALGFLRGQGMAPGANMVEQLYSPFFTQPGGMLLLMTDSYTNGASLSGNSWGPAGSPLGYDDDTLQVDIGVRDADPNTAGNQPLSYVLSFMNGNGGTSTQGTPDEAKNIFTIGSTKMQNASGTQILDINDLSTNSAHGPALDGRTIPHMVAPGCNVDSTVPSGYDLLCGTSMASPHVSGAVALFIEYYRGLHGVDPSPALVKAAFLPVAHDLAGNLDADGGTLGHPFDSKQGWGRMDVAAVVSPTLDTIYFDNPLIFNNIGEEWVQTISPADPTQPIRLMLVWTDAPGHGLGGSTPAWNNDLNLVVEAGGNTYYGNDFDSNGWSQSGGSADTMNNTEGIFLGPTPPGNVTVRVVANNINSDGIPNQGDTTDQDFALACVNCTLGADFAIAAAPSSLEVCIPNEAIYDVDVIATGGYSQIVNLSAINNPVGTTASFSVNGQAAPYTSTLTISNTIAATPGTYAIDIVGMGPTSTHTATVGLDLFTAAPTAPSLVAPANGASGVLTSPTFEWTAVANASSYHLEVATDATFSTLVYTATVAAPATSHTAGISLSGNTVYYWRVTANNPCGSGPASSAFSFLTVNFFCSTPSLPISSGPHTDDMIITTAGTISDVNVSLDISHTWVGDLIVAIEHVDTGTSVTIVDQPGAPPGSGCSGDDIEAILDDEAGMPVEDACSSTPPAIGGTFSPNNSLDAFDGEDLNGTWRISISDAFPTTDDGVLNEWCIIPELPGAPEIAVEPAGLSSTQQPDTILTHTLTISNVGGGLLDWTVVEQNPSTFLETVTVATYPETAESAANLTPSMQAFLQDKEPVQNLEPMGATPCVNNMAGSYACSNIDLLSFLPLSTIGGGEGNDIWGWTGCNGREFALMGRTNGTSFVEITDPANPVYLGNLPPHTGNSTWRDIKTYADHAFIVSEAGSHGMQVFDLTQLCSITAPPVTFSETTHYNGFGNAHNLVINEDSGYAYGVGTNTCSGGLHMVNIQNPLSPSNAGCFSADGYTHDAQCVNYHGPDTEHQGKEICLNANVDTLTIVDVTNKTTPAQLSRTGYIGSDYTHQGWITEDHAYFLLDDEGDETGFGHNTRTYIWDLADLDNPLLIDNYTASTAAIDHNLYIKGNYAFEANYRAGLRILDIHDIANGNLFEEAYFDIYPGSDSASFNGAWSNYPYFDSGVVVVSGIEQGLYVLQPTTLPGVCTSPSDIPWLTVSPTSGTTLENSSTLVNVIFDSTGLAPGEYTASLCIQSNAATMPQVQVPVTLTVPSNQVPVAGDDVYTTTQKMALSVAAPGVLSNDTDGDGQPLTAVLATGPSNGILSINADGSFIYTPTVGFNGSDSFTYRATDGINSSNVATVIINVTNPQIFLPFVASDD